jgi:hypothetical protein
MSLPCGMVDDLARCCREAGRGWGEKKTEEQPHALWNKNLFAVAQISQSGARRVAGRIPGVVAELTRPEAYRPQAPRAAIWDPDEPPTLISSSSSSAGSWCHRQGR